MISNRASQGPKAVTGMDQPGAFQCMLVRAFDLKKTDRDVFLLKEIKGYSLPQIAAILNISRDEATIRLKRASREICPEGESHAVGAGGATTRANTLQPTKPWKNRLHLTGLRSIAFLTTATDETVLGCWARDKFQELVEVAQRTVPTVIVAALNILR